MQSYLKAVKKLFNILCFLISFLVFQYGSSNTSPLNFTTQPTFSPQKSLNVIYQNNTLTIQGIQINGNLKIYTIIGNKIVDKNIQDFSKVVIPINLEKQNLYIIRIETTDNQIFTRKIVAH